jgi:hypothetical protein
VRNRAIAYHSQNSDPGRDVRVHRIYLRREDRELSVASQGAEANKVNKPTLKIEISNIHVIPQTSEEISKPWRS